MDIESWKAMAYVLQYLVPTEALWYLPTILCSQGDGKNSS